MTNLIKELEQEQLKTDLPEFAVGDTVRVQVKVKEVNRERLQAFEGVVIAKKNRGLNSSFTVRKISYGEGVERVFQTHSPMVDWIRSKYADAAMLDEPSCIICAAVRENLPGSKKRSPDTSSNAGRIVRPGCDMAPSCRRGSADDFAQWPCCGPPPYVQVV